MTSDHAPRIPALHALLASSELQSQELRAGIGSDLTSTEDKMKALRELAHLSSDLTSLLVEVIRAESK
jgi:hypothetical protein